LREAGRLEFYRATVDQGIVRLLENQASGAVVAMARANALCVVPAETTHLDKDAEVDVIPFSELGL
jgi:molybdopterin biosynthesis enzyme